MTVNDGGWSPSSGTDRAAIAYAAHHASAHHGAPSPQAPTVPRTAGRGVHLPIDCTALSPYALVADGPQPLWVYMQALTTARPHFPIGTRSWPTALKRAKSWIPAAHPSASLLYLYDGQVIDVDCDGAPLTVPQLPLMASASLLTDDH